MSLVDAIPSTAVAEDTKIAADSNGIDTGMDDEAVKAGAEGEIPLAELVTEVATREHAFHAFDALYCELTGDTPVGEPSFPNEK
jgi:hypothetical protein